MRDAGNLPLPGKPTASPATEQSNLAAKHAANHAANPAATRHAVPPAVGTQARLSSSSRAPVLWSRSSCGGAARPSVAWALRLACSDRASRRWRPMAAHAQRRTKVRGAQGSTVQGSTASGGVAHGSSAQGGIHAGFASCGGALSSPTAAEGQLDLPWTRHDERVLRTYDSRGPTAPGRHLPANSSAYLSHLPRSASAASVGSMCASLGQSASCSALAACSASTPSLCARPTRCSGPIRNALLAASAPSLLRSRSLQSYEQSHSQSYRSAPKLSVHVQLPVTVLTGPVPSEMLL